MRKAVVATAALLVAVLAVIAAVPRLVHPDRLAARLVAALEERTGRKVAFSRAALSLFPAIAIRVSDIEISGEARNPTERLLVAPRAEFRVGLLPLLAGRADVSKIVFRRPDVTFRKGRDGTTSLTDLAARLAAPPKGGVAGAAAAAPAVRPKTVVIDGGRLSLRLEDRSGKETVRRIAPFSLRMSGLGGSAPDVEVEMTVDGAVRGPVSLEARWRAIPGRWNEPPSYSVTGKGAALDQPYSLEGTVSDPFGRVSADLSVTFSRIAMRGVPGVLADPEKLKGKELEGHATLSVKLSGEPEEFGFEVEADLSRAGWVYRGGIRKFIDAPFSIVLQGRRFPDQVIVSNAEFRFPPLLLIANVSQTLSTGAREWSASSRIGSLEEFAKSRGGFPEIMPAGVVTASGKGRRAASGAPEDWQVGLDLGNTGFQLPGRGIEFRGLNGHVELSPQSYTFLPLTGLLNGQGFSLRGTVSRGPAPRGQVAIRMAYLDLDSLMPGRRPGGGRPASILDLLGDASAHARVEIDGGKAAGIEFQGLRGEAVYDNGTIAVDSARAGLCRGTVSFSGRIDTRGPSPRFRVRAAGNGVQVGELLALKTSLGDFLSGAADFSGEISAGSRDFADFAGTAAGSGSVRITGGRMKGVDIERTTLVLAGLSPRVEGAAISPGRGVQGENDFSEMSLGFKLAGGRIRMDAFRMASDRITLSGSAAVGLDRTVEFQGTVTLPRGVGGPGAAFPVDRSGRVAVPVVISGALVSPAIAIDSQPAARGAQ